MITAEDKFKYIESTNKTYHYIYYHRTKKNKNHKCKQKVITVQKELKKQEPKLNNLTDLLLEERIDTDDFDRRKNE